MDFFSNLSSKLSVTGKSVADKAKEMTEITKLNAKIVAEESKLNKAYTEIGKICFEKCQCDMGEECAEYVDAAKSAMEAIAAAKEQIKTLKGVRECVNCGKELGKNDLFCGNCGTKNELPVVEEEEKVVDQICPVCKSFVPAEVQFCPTCGEKLTVEAADMVEAAVEVVEDAAEAVEDAVEDVVEEIKECCCGEEGCDCE